MTKQEILSKYAQDRTRCTVYTRVMGYHRPVETFNAGKQGEFHDRVQQHMRSRWERVGA